VVVGGGCLDLGEGGVVFSGESFSGGLLFRRQFWCGFVALVYVDYGGGFAAPAIGTYDGGFAAPTTVPAAVSVDCVLVSLVHICFCHYWWS
jgi:hypothetical protein